MQILKATSLAGLALLLTSCLRLYDVKQDKTELAGVPFYTRAAVCRQKTVWLEPTYVLLLQVQKLPAAPGQPPPPPEELATEKLGLTAYKNAKEQLLPELMRDITTGGLDAEQALQRFQHLISEVRKALGQPLSGRVPDDFVLAGNTSTTEAVVDYSKPHTYNVRTPLAGTASSTVKLNSDGTLGEATASVEDKTFETILSLIPLKEFLSAEFVDTEGASEAESMTEGEKSDRAGEPFRILLTVSTTVSRRTLSKDDPVTGVSCAAPTATLGPGQTPGASYQVEEVKEASAADKKPDPAKTIQLSGQVILPDEKKPNP